MEFKLGQEISIEHKLVRKTSHDNRKGGQRLKNWSAQKIGQKRVIVVGERVLQNGRTHWDGEYGYVFSPMEYFKALLVCESLKSKPFYIFDPRTSPAPDSEAAHD